MIDYGYGLIVLTGVALNVVGLIGCFIPVLPGPTLNLISLVMLHFYAGASSVSLTLVGWMCLLVLIAMGMDNLLPIITARAGGSSRYGIIGASIGLLAGIFFFPPFGIVLGAFTGALAGEYYGQRSKSAAFKAGVATIVGFGLSLAFKLAVSGVITWFFAESIFRQAI